MKGLFITFEGPDGAGKTTQLKRFANTLQQQGYNIVVTREPGGTFISDKIRSIILSPEHKEMADQTEILLYAASRAQHVHEKIIPALDNGCIVLCDRYIDASIAYQAYGLGYDQEKVKAINRFASSGLQPNRTYLLDIPPETGRIRLEHRVKLKQTAELDRIELKDTQYHQKVREGFAQIAKENPDRIYKIDAVRSEDEIAEVIMRDFQRLLNDCNSQK